jgi:cytochrome oxidase Cu insertion factor (SCO1/SenC/PrrC family)
MRILLMVAVAALAGGAPVGVSGAAGGETPRPAALAPGDPAPPFALKGSDGRTYRLADYRGKQAVVLAWFAKAFTGG